MKMLDVSSFLSLSHSILACLSESSETMVMLRITLCDERMSHIDMDPTMRLEFSINVYSVSGI